MRNYSEAADLRQVGSQRKRAPRASSGPAPSVSDRSPGRPPIGRSPPAEEAADLPQTGIRPDGRHIRHKLHETAGNLVPILLAWPTFLV